MIFLKQYTKYDIFVKCSEKMVFSKRTTPGHGISCTIWKGGIFYRKHGIFSLDGKRQRNDLSQEIHGNMIFSVRYVPRRLAKKKKKKNQRRPYPAKIHVKVMDIPDRHPRKSSSNSLYLHERPLQAF